MKSKTETGQFVRYLTQCLAISTALQFCAFAQEEKVVNVNNDSAPVNVDGQGIEEEDIVDGELQYLDNELKKQGQQIKLNSKKTQKYKKLQNTTEKLSNTTEKYVEEKKASEKTIKEYNLKIKCLLDESGTDPDCDGYRQDDVANESKAKPSQVQEVVKPAVEDKVQVQQAAPQPVIIQNIMPEQKSEKKELSEPESIPLSLENTIEKTIPAEKVELEASDKMKVYPYIGMSSFDGTDVSGIQTNSLVGIRLESKPFAGRLAMGAGVSYKQLTTKDSGGSVYIVDPYFAPEVDMSSTGIDLYAKLILIKDSAFMPYITGGFGYNIMQLQYAESGSFVNPVVGSMGGNAQRNFVTGTVGGGIDYAFTPAIGANLELNYSKGVSSFDNQNASYSNGYYGQARLQELANSFTNANLFTVQAGLLVFF
jgi:opacity protein-like surface antigen